MNISGWQSDQAVLAELGQRLQGVRLERNIRQEHLAKEAGVSIGTLRHIEEGSSVTLSSFVRILRALGMLENLDLVVPEELPSPLGRWETKGRRRRRASSRSPGGSVRTATGQWPWTTGGIT